MIFICILCVLVGAAFGILTAVFCLAAKEGDLEAEYRAALDHWRQIEI